MAGTTKSYNGPDDGMVPVNIVQEYGVTVFSRWRSRRTGTDLIVIRRSMVGADMCNEIEVLEVAKEQSSIVPPKSWLNWIAKGSIFKVRN